MIWKHFKSLNSIQFRTFDLEDIDLNLFIGNFLQLFFQFIHFLTAFTDNNSRTGGIDRDSDELQL